MEQILKKSYSYEEIIDLEEDIYEAMDRTNIPGDYEGLLTITVTYSEDQENERTYPNIR